MLLGLGSAGKLDLKFHRCPGREESFSCYDGGRHMDLS